MLTFTDLTDEEYRLHTLTWDRLWKCKCKCEATSQHSGASINNFDSRLVSLWPSFYLHSQSLHLCLTVFFPLLWPARTSLSFILILFHASSFSCSVLIHHHPNPALHTPPPPVSCLTHHFIGPCLAFITSQHLYNHPTETHQNWNQIDFIW